MTLMLVCYCNRRRDDPLILASLLSSFLLLKTFWSVVVYSVIVPVWCPYFLIQIHDGMLWYQFSNLQCGDLNTHQRIYLLAIFPTLFLDLSPRCDGLHHQVVCSVVVVVTQPQYQTCWHLTKFQVLLLVWAFDCISQSSSAQLLPACCHLSGFRYLDHMMTTEQTPSAEEDCEMWLKARKFYELRFFFVRNELSLISLIDISPIITKVI